MKDSFLLYTEQKEMIDKLSNEDAGKLIKAVYNYVATGETEELEGLLGIVFIPFKQSIDRNQEKYQKTVEKRREAGKTGGRPKASGFSDEAEKAKGSLEKAKKAKGFSEKQSKAKKPDSDSDNVSDSDNEKELKDFCPEPEAAGPEPIITLPLNDKSQYPVFEGAVQEWAELYPAVDVIQQLRNMKGWLIANPTRRKTKSGIERYINAWLAKEQNRGGQGRAAPKSKKEFNYEQREWDFDELERIKRSELIKGAGTED